MESEIMITADDVIRAGACVDGVYKAIRSAFDSGKQLPACLPADVAAKLFSHNQEYVIAAACGNCYGYGEGYGDGDGNGGGCGDGGGDGYGGGDGDGDGNGDGNGGGYGGGYGDYGTGET